MHTLAGQYQLIAWVVFYLIPDIFFSTAYQKYRAFKKKQAIKNESLFQQQDLSFQLIRFVAKCETIGQKLKKIYLNSSQLTDGHFQQLRQAHWPNVTYASFRDNHFGPHSAKILSTFKWANLTAIQLDNNNFGAEGILYLRQAQWPNLQNLNVSNNNIGNEGFLELAKNKTWKRLTHLQCISNNLNHSHLYKLSTSTWINLQYIDLRLNDISRRGVKELVRCSLIDLRTLFLSDCCLDDEGLIQLSKGKWKLQSICIQSNAVADRGIRFLRYGGWPKLQEVSFTVKKYSRNALMYLACSNWSTSPPLLHTSYSKYEMKNIISNKALYERFQ